MIGAAVMVGRIATFKLKHYPSAEALDSFFLLLILVSRQVRETLAFNTLGNERRTFLQPEERGYRIEKSICESRGDS